MSIAITSTVNFKVTVWTEERDGHWVATTRETLIATYAETEEEAIRINAAANQKAVRSFKELGTDALADYMLRMGIDYSIDDSPITIQPSHLVDAAETDRELGIAA